ncbi:hypothetical protein Hhel01_02301 [Haloferula helveola]
MNPQLQANHFRPCSPMGADQSWYACGDVSVRTETTLFIKGRGGPAER